MPETRITLNFKQKVVVWNREVVYADFNTAQAKAFIIAGNEYFWLQALEGKYFTPDFYVQLIEYGVSYVKLYIKYGTDAPLKWRCSGAPNYICYQTSDGIYATEAECRAVCKGAPCNPVWKCEQPLNGWENDGCGSRRRNATCDPTPSCGTWECESPLNGYEKDNCGHRRLASRCNPPGPPCTPNWVCEQPLNGYESDGCGRRAYNSLCLPETPTSPPCADGNTRTVECPKKPGVMVTQKCTGGKWITISTDEKNCPEGEDNTFFYVLVVIVIVLVFLNLMKGRRS